MQERISRIHSELSRQRAVGPFKRLGAHINALAPGDRFIAYALIGLVLFASILGLYGLERYVLVPVPAYGGTLDEGIVGAPRFVNPLLALSDADRDLVALTFAGLMGEDGDGKLVPVLAESYTVSEDGKTYTFVLRDNAKFSDGTQVTADDVVFTIEKAQDPGLKSPEYADWTGVAARAEDPMTVSFTLAKPYAPFLQNATLGIIPRHLWQDVTDEEFPFSPLMENPVGAGPFAVSSAVRNSNGVITEYDLSAFRGYAPGRAYLSGINFHFFPQESDLVDALDTGAVESAYGVSATGGLRAPYSRVFGVFFNANENPAFARAEVRHALSIAVDRERISSNVLAGFATPLAGPVPPGSGITETPVPAADTRIADAAKVLTDAGWKYDTAARLWTLAKPSLTLTLTVKTSNVPELKAVAASVQSDWEALGVPVSIELYEPGDLTQNVIRPRKYDALLFGMVIGRDRDLYAFWDSAERNDPGLNIALYANHSVDELIEQMRAEESEDAATTDLQKVNDLISADYPAAFTHAPAFVYTVPGDLHGVALPQIASPSDRFASVAHWYRESEYVWPFLVPYR